MVAPDFQYTIRAPMVRDVYDQENRDRELEDHLNTYATLSTLYVPFSQHGGIVADDSGWYRVPFDATLTDIWVRLTTASSSGSVVVRVSDGTTNWDNTLTASTTTSSSTPNASLTEGDYIRASVTSAGTAAEDLVVIVALVPA